jgi:hypothetical protein
MLWHTILTYIVLYKVVLKKALCSYLTMHWCGFLQGIATVLGMYDERSISDYRPVL